MAGRTCFWIGGRKDDDKVAMPFWQADDDVVRASHHWLEHALVIRTVRAWAVARSGGAVKTYSHGPREGAFIYISKAALTA